MSDTASYNDTIKNLSIEFKMCFFINIFRLAVNEKAERVAKCTEEVCTGLVEETLNADIAVLVEEILDAELQRIHKYIKR